MRSYNDTIKSQRFLLIIFFVLFIFIPNFCNAQYLSSLFGGYSGYPSWNHPAQNSIIGIYSKPGEIIMNPFSYTRAYDYNYKSLPDFTIMIKTNIMNPFSMTSGLTLLYGNLAALGMNGTNMTNSLWMIGGLIPLDGNTGGLEMMFGFNPFGGLNPSRVDNLAGLDSLGETGNLAGLISLGSSAGLIFTGMMSIATSSNF